MKARAAVTSFVLALSVAAPGVTAAAGAHPPVCDAGWKYTRIDRKVNRLKRVGPVYSNFNGTDHEARVRLNATRNDTVSFRVTVGVEVAAKAAIFAEVRAKVEASVERSITTGRENEITITVDPHRWGNGSYGVWRVVTTGRLYYLTDRCNVTRDYGRVKSLAPLTEGWCTWQSRFQGVGEPKRCR